MVTALVRLREALAGVALPLDVPGAEAHRKMRGEMVDHGARWEPAELGAVIPKLLADER